MLSIGKRELPKVTDIYTNDEVMQGIDFLYDLVHESDAKNTYELLDYAEKVTADSFNQYNKLNNIKGE